MCCSSQILFFLKRKDPLLKPLCAMATRLFALSVILSPLDSLHCLSLQVVKSPWERVSLGTRCYYSQTAEGQTSHLKYSSPLQHSHILNNARCELGV